MDPASSGDLQKLREAIRHSQNELEPFRQQYRERLVQYAGDGYGDNRDAVDSPFNVYNLALRIYKRRLFSGQMRVVVTSRSPSERRAAWELGLAGRRRGPRNQAGRDVRQGAAAGNHGSHE